MKGRHYTGLKKKGIREPSVPLIILAIIFALILVRSFVIDVAVVDGRSMQPSLRHGDVVFILKLAYGLRTPSGSYCIVWARPENRDVVAAVRPNSNAVVIKRVSGERRDAEESMSFFLLGDNLYESVDSRDFGPVPMNNILGKVFNSFRF